jgi:hypothetical protein
MIVQQLFTAILQSSVLPQWLINLGQQIEHAFAPVRAVIKPILSSPVVAGIWAVLVLTSLGIL